jgi:hypothetical protein
MATREKTEIILVGTLDYVDGAGVRLIVAGLAFTLAPGVRIEGLRRGHIVQVRYLEGRERRLAVAVRRLGAVPAAR